MDQGYLWLDSELVVRGFNRAYRALLEIEGADLFLGRPYEDLRQFLQRRGEFADRDASEISLAARLKSAGDHEPLHSERVRSNGTVLRITAAPMRSGGYLYTYLDVTAETRAREDLQRNAKATVVAMANFAEHRDTDTGVHVLRVARLVGQIARQLQRNAAFSDVIDDDFVEHIGTASILHDVGKISTPDRILLKTGPLSDDERTAIKQHAAVGAQLLRQANMMIGDSQYMKLGTEIALTHHEWFDGSGYPAGLSGTAIPLAGRICAVADVFDALTSRRPYKKPWATEKAVELIRSQSGIQFDPVIVDAFVAVIEARDKVSLVRWSESMSVGDTHIDEQHMILIDTINQLASAEAQNDRTTVSMIIDELVAYTVFHFHYEEQLMESIRYPYLEAHRRVHQKFVDWVGEVREEFITTRQTHLGERILGFLRDWLRDHILGDDRRYSPFLGSTAGDQPV
jgi:hemerythrin-like metal-binding protein